VPNLRPEDRITPGMQREDALRALRECVNQPGTIFSTDFWLLPKLERLRQLLHEPITGDEAAAIVDVLYQRREMRSLIEWLEDEPVSWRGHFIRAAFRAEEVQRQRQEELRKLDEEWEKGITPLNSPDVGPGMPDPEEEARRRAELLTDAKARHLPKAVPCPSCRTPPEHLEWFWYSSPPSTWENLCGRAGWKTRCRFCLREVNFFIELLN
jgi:hypothetical protein